MLWDVTDDGRVLVRLRSSGVGAKMLDKDGVNRYIANIVGDLAVTESVDIVTDELRISFSKVRPEVNVTWRARVPVGSVTAVREYMAVYAASEAPGE